MTRPASGLILVTAVVAAPLCTIAGLIPSIAGVCYAGLAAFAVVAAIDAFRLTRIIAGWEVSALPALRWFKDREETLEISLRHVSGAAQELRLHVALPPEIKAAERTISARIDGAGVVEVRCTPRARGDFTLSAVDVEQRSPLRLWSGSRGLAIGSGIRVYPDLRKERAADLIRSHHLLGTHSRRQLGKGREFEKLREYEHGDSFEDIDWKATARRQKPVVKVFQIERTQEIYTVIDSSRLSKGIVDAYVSAALALAITAESQHDRFGLVSFSAGVDTFVPAASGKRHFAFCRDAIYMLQPRPVTPDLEEVFSYLHTHLRKRSLIIFLTALDDPFLAEAFTNDVRVLSRRHVVLVNVPERADVRPLFSGPLPEMPDQIYTKLAGHMQWAGLRELQKRLERKGVRLAMVNPSLLPAQLARQYLDVKRRQLL